MAYRDKTTFWTKYIKNIFGFLFCRFKILKVIEENTNLKKYNKELIIIGFSATQMSVCIKC